MAISYTEVKKTINTRVAAFARSLERKIDVDLDNRYYGGKFEFADFMPANMNQSVLDFLREIYSKHGWDVEFKDNVLIFTPNGKDEKEW